MKIQARDFGHPLIHPEKCVRNDIDIDNYSCIITGSNMSGKSTFLRAIGMNLVSGLCRDSRLCLGIQVFYYGRIYIYGDKRRFDWRYFYFLCRIDQDKYDIKAGR